MAKSQPEILTLGRMTSPLGMILVVSDSEGAVRALDFPDFLPRMKTLLTRHWGAVSLFDGGVPPAAKAALEAYFSRDPTALDHLPVKTRGTAFQESIWAALRQIPFGETRSYGQLAEAVGNPKAVRAAGLANGRNPVALIVPCHRVIGANGSLTGYAGGLERKRWLLQHEGVAV
jgi:O-6-methylguanine DNA methyltransferase